MHGSMYVLACICVVFQQKRMECTECTAVIRLVYSILFQSFLLPGAECLEYILLIQELEYIAGQ